jgi:hypothetical protein
VISEHPQPQPAGGFLSARIVAIGALISIDEDALRKRFEQCLDIAATRVDQGRESRQERLSGPTPRPSLASSCSACSRRGEPASPLYCNDPWLAGHCGSPSLRTPGEKPGASVCNDVWALRWCHRYPGVRGVGRACAVLWQRQRTDRNVALAVDGLVRPHRDRGGDRRAVLSTALESGGRVSVSPIFRGTAYSMSNTSTSSRPRTGPRAKP